MGSSMIVTLSYMMIVIIFVMVVAVIAFYNLLKDSAEKENKRTANINDNKLASVLVPDNVKKESQSVSTQKSDAKVYDVNAEKKALLSKGYHKVGEGTYQKSDKVYSSVPENYIKENKKEYNPIDDKNEHKKIFTGNDEEDDDPIKDM